MIKYRLEQANKLIIEVQFLINNQIFQNAVNRIYYGVFYALTGLALLHKFETSKHNQLIGWFNQHFVYNGIFDKKYSKILKHLYESRQKGDYEPFIAFTESDVKDLYSQMKDFISTIEKYILENQNNIL